MDARSTGEVSKVAPSLRCRSETTQFQQKTSLIRTPRERLAINILFDVALNTGSGGVTTSGRISDRLNTPRRALEPVLQQLARAEMLFGSRGPNGGYRLLKRPNEILLSDAVRAAAGHTREVHQKDGTLQSEVIDPLRNQINCVLMRRLATLSLADLLDTPTLAGC